MPERKLDHSELNKINERILEELEENSQKKSDRVVDKLLGQSITKGKKALPSRVAPQKPVQLNNPSKKIMLSDYKTVDMNN